MQRQNILSQIEEDISKFHEILSTEKNKLVLEEKVLDVLGEIEAKVSQVIGDKNGRNILQKEEVFQRYLSLNHIESQYRSIDDFLDELIVKLSQELNQRKIKLKFDLFERGNSQIDGNGIAKEKIEIKTSQKNKIFLRVLHKMGIDFSDVKQFEETLTPERMRKVPYQIYHIITGNIQKTVLISDQIGQATFVYDTIIEPAIFQIIEKGEEIEGHKALKIIYNQKNYEKNLEIALNNKLTFEEKEVQIVNEEKEKADGVKEKLTKEQLFQKLWNYEGRSEQESYNYFMLLLQKEIRKIVIGGKKIESLITISGINIQGQVQCPSVFQEWIKSVFEGKKIITIKEQLFQKLWNYEGRSEQESYNYFMGLLQNEIGELKILGNRIILLKKISGINITGKIRIPNGFQEWIEKIFEGKNIVRVEKLSKKQLFEKLWNYGGRSEQQSYNYFTGLSAREISKLELLGNKIVYLKTLSGIEVEGYIGTPSVFQEWIEKIFEGKNIVRIEKLSKKQLFEKLWNYEGRNEQESYNYFMSLTGIGIGELELLGNKVVSLKNLSGIKIQGDVTCSSAFKEWIEKVFKGRNVLKNQRKIFQLDCRNQVRIEGIVYTAVTKTMKQSNFQDLPDNGGNILRKMQKLTPEQKIDLGGIGLEARIGSSIVKLYELKKIQEIFRVIVLNNKNQVEIGGIIYTAVTGTMKQPNFQDLPDNGENILRKIRKLTSEQRAELGGVGLEAKKGPNLVEIYELKKIQEMFGKK